METDRRAGQHPQPPTEVRSFNEGLRPNTVPVQVTRHAPEAVETRGWCSGRAFRSSKGLLHCQMPSVQLAGERPRLAKEAWRLVACNAIAALDYVEHDVGVNVLTERVAAAGNPQVLSDGGPPTRCGVSLNWVRTRKGRFRDAMEPPSLTAPPFSRFR